MLQYYFKTAYRNLIKHKVSSGINIFGLALGICVCVIIFLVTRFELSFDRFHPDGKRIYRIVTLIQNPIEGKIHLPFIPNPAIAAIQREFTGIDGITMFHNYTAKVSIQLGGRRIRHFEVDDGNLSVTPIIITDPDYFKVFKYQWLEGNATVALKDPFRVVLTENEARKYFGSLPLDEVMGKMIIYDDSLHVTVSGIVRDWGKNTDFGFEDFISSATVKSSFLKNDFNMDNWDDWDGGQVFVLLDAGTTAAHVNAQFPKLVRNNIHLGQGKASFFLQPLLQIHTSEDFHQPFQAHLPTLYGLMAISGFILIIAVVNFVNLSTAQSLQRSREIGIRKVLGSKRQSLEFQFLSETFLITSFAVFISLLAINPLLTLLHNFIPDGVVLSLKDLSTDGFLLVLTLLTSLLAGFYPARILASYPPALSLKGKGDPGVNQKGMLRKVLIVFQFTISIGFIIGTLIIGKQIGFMLNKDMGFVKNAIIHVRTANNYPSGKVKVLADEIRHLAAVRMVSRNQGPPADLNYISSTGITYQGNDVDIQVLTGDDHYVPLYQLKIIAGRNLRFTDSINEILINATCARKLGFTNPADAVGKLVHLGFGNGPTEVKRPVVGILADFHSQSLHDPIRPVALVTSDGNNISIKFDSGTSLPQIQAVLGQVEMDWKTIYPGEKFEYRFFNEQIAKFYDQYRKTSTIMDMAMFISILISCMGLFGLITFTAQQRTKEIGVRKVLGAGISEIIILLSRDFLILVMIALLISAPIAWYFMTRWLQDFAYHIDASIWIFILAGLSALCIALFTVSFQAIKAARANPVNSLRSE